MGRRTACTACTAIATKEKINERLYASAGSMQKKGNVAGCNEESDYLGNGAIRNRIDTIHIDTLGGFLFGGDFLSGSLLEESSCCSVFVSVACPFSDSLFADFRLLLAVTLLLLMLFTAMLPIL